VVPRYRDIKGKPWRVGLVGPLPPPFGGMAKQTEQLARLLRAEDIGVEIVRTNAPYRPRWIARVRGARAIFRLIPYLCQLWAVAGRVALFHVMANSGWAWHLFAAPALLIAKLRGVPVVLNYRGGNAEAFFQQSFRWVKSTLRLADVVVVPSTFLCRVFQELAIVARIVPNIIDLDRFASNRSPSAELSNPHIIITRNLESIYDIGTGLHAFALIVREFPTAHLTIAGSGPERRRLEALADTLGIRKSVSFAGILDDDAIAELYRSADVMINPSLIDNMPISILEAWASRVPVVSTNVGGVPLLVRHAENGLLVPPSEPEAMANAVLLVLTDPCRRKALSDAGRDRAQQYAWSNVRDKLFQVYKGLLCDPT
jgi:L-malate glycosyltransferase